MASGAGIDKEVGRLSIRVVPDLTGFREEVRAEALGAGKDIEVPVDADTTKARAKVRELTDEKYDMRIDLDADAKGLRAKVKAETEGMSARVKINVDEGALDLAKKRIDRFLTNESLEVGKANQRLLATMRDFTPQAAAGRDLAALEQRIKLHPHMDEHDIEEMRLRLAHENFTIKVKMQKDEASLHNLMQSAERDLDRIFDKHLGQRNRGPISGLLGLFGAAGQGAEAGAGLASKSLKIPDLIPNIGGLGAVGSVGIIVAALSLLAPALALVSQAIIGVPALIAGLALPIGVFALGLGGIKKALDASGLLDLVTGKKGKQTQGLGEELKKMQKSVSDVFEQGFTPLFKQVAGALPALTRGLPFVAKGIVDLATGLTNALVSPENIANFDRFTNSVSSMLTNLGPGMNSFATGMLQLITNVGDHLPGLGTTLSGYAERFSKWVTDMSKPTSTPFWGKDVQGPSPIDSAITNIKPVLDSVINFVGNLVDTGTKLAGDPKMIQGIQDFITGLQHLAEQIATMGPLFENIAHILGLIPAPSPPPKNPDGSVNTSPNAPGNAAGVPGVTRRLAEPGRHDQVGGDWVDDIANSILHPFKTLWSDLKIMGGDIASPFKSLWGMLGMGQAAADTTPFNAGKPLAPGSPPVPVQVVQGPSTAGLFPGGPGNPIQGTPPPPIAPIAPGGTQGAEIKAPKIEVPKLPPGSEQIWEPLIAATQAAAGTVNGSVQQMVGQITASLQGLGPAGNAAGTALGTGLAGGIAASAPSALAAAQALGQGVADALRGPGGVDAHSPSKKSHKTGQDFAQGFDDGMSEGFQGVVSKAQALADQVSEAMKSGVLSPELKGQVGRELQAIGIQYDQLKQQKDALDPKDKEGRQGISAQMKQLQALRTELGLDQKESKYAEKYGGKGSGSDSTSQAASMITQALASGLDALKGMAMANVGQLETDLGMSGNGAVEKLADYGIGFLSSAVNSVAQGAFGGGSTNNFYSADHDGMMKDYDRVKNRESMEHTQRSN